MEFNEEDRIPMIGEVGHPEESGVGDLYNEIDEKYNKYWNEYNRTHINPAQTPVAVPTKPFPHTGDPLMDGLTRWLETRFTPQFQRILEWFKEEMKCGTYFVKRNAYIDPTETGLRIDKKVQVNRPILLPAVGPAGPFTEILRVDIPDLMFGVIWGIGQFLSDNSDFGIIEWQEQRNGATLLDGQYFFQKADPTALFRDTEPVPIFIPPLGNFVLRARNVTPAGPVIEAVARITGQQVAVKDLSINGTFSTYHVT